MFSHVLMPVASSHINHRILRNIAQRMRQSGARITLVHVSDPLPPGFYSASPLGESFLSPREHQKACEHYAQTLFEKLTRELGKDIVEGQCHIMNREVSAGILEAAKSRHADAIAMVSRKYAGIKRLILGSHTQEVMHASRLPVIVF